MKKIIKMRQDGFTLIEILMAVLIIVILAVVGITQFSNFSADAKNAATKSNLAILRNAIGTMNALERVRCQKTSLLFPDVATIQNNDITGCTNGPTATAACNPGTLLDPNTNALYTAGTSGVCPSLKAGSYLTLIPAIDRPYVQNAIPNNPWTAPISTDAPNLVTGDTLPVSPLTACYDAPVTTPGATVKAKRCLTAHTAFTSLSATGEAGWCYCQSSGLIWANSANNDGASAGSGMESTF